jgi:hypothetical protein
MYARNARTTRRHRVRALVTSAALVAAAGTSVAFATPAVAARGGVPGGGGGCGAAACAGGGTVIGPGTGSGGSFLINDAAGFIACSGHASMWFGNGTGHSFDNSGCIPTP